jgi:hypothetical protein
MSNYLIGKAELLTYPIKAPKKNNGNKFHPYSLAEAKEVLLPQIESANSYLNRLTATEAPGDIAAIKLTLHPAYIAKSYFPRAFLGQAGLVAIGSKTVRVSPRKRTSAKMPESADTTQLIVAGRRSQLRGLQAFAQNLADETPEAVEFRELESISAMTEADRVKPLRTNAHVFEVGLHLLPDQTSADAVAEFALHAAVCGFKVNGHYLFEAGRLAFVAVEGDAQLIPALARYSLIRVVREMPKIRGVRPAGTRPGGLSIPFVMPPFDAISREPTVAILDGGLPPNHVLQPYVRRYLESDPDAHDIPEHIAHGLGVTSAVLFGNIVPGQMAERPYANVDHYRVLDSLSDEEDPYELYRTLGHVETILLSRQYQFVNLSLGPDLPFDDGDIHPWTSVIDNILSDGRTLLTVAAGNNGERDDAAELNRIQVPADGVNTLAVGAANSTTSTWDRASYSAIGPGRMPGRRKPDVVAFGGAPTEYFHHAAPGNTPQLSANLGTSFAAPLALRSAIGIRATMGSEVNPLTTRALLLHACEADDHHNHDHVGWGRVQTDLSKVIACDEHSARIIYQGTLAPGKFLRAPIPLPADALSGMVNIRATFCFACAVDPQDASAYTKAGLLVSFRPHSNKFNKDAQHPKTHSLFRSAELRKEAENRADLGKWETVLQGQDNFRGSSLFEPAFDIHYNARDSGAPTTHAVTIPYSLVVTIRAPKYVNIHKAILDAHTKLRVLAPLISIPVST